MYVICKMMQNSFRQRANQQIWSNHSILSISISRTLFANFFALSSMSMSKWKKIYLQHEFYFPHQCTSLKKLVLIDLGKRMQSSMAIEYTKIQFIWINVQMKWSYLKLIIGLKYWTHFFNNSVLNVSSSFVIFCCPNWSIFSKQITFN